MHGDLPFKATGLGLTIAWELVKRLGGELTAELTGDVFTVSASLPLSAAALRQDRS